MVEIDGEILRVDSHCGPYGFFVTLPSNASLRTFCINVAATPEEPHIYITLDVPQNDMSGDFYLHLNLHKEAHSLIQDTYGTGACFAVLRRQSYEVEVRFESALRFCHCWENHPEDEQSDMFLPVEAETAQHRISISLHPRSVYKPSTQRPADLFDFFPKSRLSLKVTLPIIVALWFASAGICIVGHIKFGFSFFAFTWVIILFFPFLTMTYIMYLTKSSWLMSYTTGNVAWYVKVAWSRWSPTVYNVRIWSRWVWIHCKPGVIWIRGLKPRRDIFKFSKKASGSTTELMSKDHQGHVKDEDVTGVNASNYDAFKDMENITYKMLDEDYARVLCAMDRQMWWADGHTE
ncbi:uncharacterized protein BDZ99DRAFT_522531 [Mytilinidion resinicola]|uniref:Uncharacterized protein n=1 Tax=Mytilinidion resinicola TaxID=574789 RepID=A0A6A6YIV0_9PEZI|nr:uncharacterized protein BDZ99DRAFT_522531 [Mytilinidion resinicola]KAF2807924.1 hypothetical protein BDZ99DRAFT_522531 [Mytilinidion resinicola]